MEFTTLFKKTSTGAIQEWNIRVYQESMNSDATTIEVFYGQVGSDKIQSTTDRIATGKNIGKKNATTPYQQAVLEAWSKWEKQKKKGYVETKEAAESDEVDDLIEGGLKPMLAERYLDIIYDKRPGHENDPPVFKRTKKATKILYPAYGQPKLDGIRCIAIIENGKCTLWTRTRKRIYSVPHIEKELETLFPITTTFDGELYNHALKAEFEKIVSIVRQKKPAKGCEIVEYHIYDLPTAGTAFFQRAATLNVMPVLMKFNYIKIVPSEIVPNEEAMLKKFYEYRAMGYEGLMLRNSSSMYVGKRCNDLQKVKEFQDDEFKITGISEGRGKLAGHAIFNCIDKKGDEFEAKMKGDTAELKKYFDNESLWKGKILTVRYQGLTGKNKVPRFPVALAIRDYE